MIRKAKPEDSERLAEIHVFCWRYSYKGIILDEILFNHLSVVKRDISFKKTIIAGSEETYVFDDGIVKGFVTVGDCRDEDVGDNALEIWGIYVDPSFMRNSIGKQLLSYCEEKAEELKRNEIVLWVLKDNVIGRTFYKKYGFRPDGTVKKIDRYNVIEIRYRKNLKLRNLQVDN